MTSLTWFLGPNGENKDILIQQVKKSIDHYINVRKCYNKNQPLLFNDSFVNSNEYIESKDILNDKVEKLNEYLKDSVHFEGLNYQSQMNGDLLVPGLVGHIAGLMYNQNNVAHQGSPKTTLLENALIIDLIKMVGFDLPNDFKLNYYNREIDNINNLKSEKDLIMPGGHLTSGGSLSNFEACWCTMWVKFLPLAIKSSFLHNEYNNLKNMKIKLFDKYKYIIDMNPWELVNIDSDEIVKLPYKISIDCILSLPQVFNIIKTYHPISLGMFEFIKTNAINPPVIIMPITAHYSFTKAATSLGIGNKNLITIQVDSKGRMIISNLLEQLLICVKNEIPVISVVCIFGSTQEGAVDDIESIFSIRNTLRENYNFYFDIHIDGAYGGYYLSLLKDSFEIESPVDVPNLFDNNGNQITNFNDSIDQFEPSLICSNYLKRQFYYCKEANTITIDPHKTGYTPYQCGALLYRNLKFKNILSISRDYIAGHSLSMGLESIEGSRGGHSVTSSYLNHCICRPNKFGYGLILKKCILISKLYFVRLLYLSNHDDLFTTFQFGVELNKSQIQYFKKECYNQDGSFKDIEILIKNDILLQQLSEIGLDLSVVCFCFNLRYSISNKKDKEYISNKDYNKFKQFNEAIMKRFSYINGPQNDLILSGTYFDSNYGLPFINKIIDSIGLNDNLPDLKLNIKIPSLRASIMNPYLYKYLNQTMNILKDNINLISRSFNNN